MSKVLVDRELLERIANKAAFLHDTRKDQDKLAAILAQQAEPAPAQDERKRVAAALRACDWSSTPIGNKAIVQRACELLTTRPEQSGLADALELAANRLDRLGLEFPVHARGYRNGRDWAEEAFIALRDHCAARIAQTAPQREQSGLVDALTQLLCWAEKQVCTHEETHRGGAIWEICDSCGAKWADDEGGRPAFVWPKAISEARAALSATPSPATAAKEE